MASTIKSVTKYPGISGEFLEIYKSPSAGNGSVITDILESYTGQGIYHKISTLNSFNQAGVNAGTSYPNYPAVIGIKRNGSKGIDLISGNVEDASLNNLSNKSVIKNKLVLNPGDSIMATSRGGYPIRPIFTNRYFGDSDIPCQFLLGNSDASIIIAYKAGIVHTSVDKGRTWTRVVVNSALTTTTFGAFFKGFFYIYHPSSTVAFKSADGITWTQFAINASIAFNSYNQKGSITVDGTTKMFAAVSGSQVYVTTDGITWNAVITGLTTVVSGMLLSDNYLYVFTSEGSVNRGRMYNKVTYQYYTPFTSDVGGGSGVNKHWNVGKLLFYTINAGAQNVLRYMIGDAYAVNGTGSTFEYPPDYAALSFIPLPNGFIYRETGNNWVYYRISSDGLQLLPKIVLPAKIFFTPTSGSTPSIIGDGGSNNLGDNVYLITPDYTLFSNADGIMFETAETVGAICHGTAITVSAIET